ncbi:MAG: hypothetical protein ACFFCZ_26420 [Promethearchaeota archaeon]
MVIKCLDLLTDDYDEGNGNHNPVRADERYKEGNEDIQITISFETMLNEVRWIVQHPEHYKYVK